MILQSKDEACQSSPTDGLTFSYCNQAGWTKVQCTLMSTLSHPVTSKGFLAKQKLWDTYKLHYLESLKGVHGVGTKKLVQENYNRLLKEKYA